MVVAASTVVGPKPALILSADLKPDTLPNTDVVCVVGLERDLQHGLKFAALLAEQECKIVLRLGAQSAATQCFASHCAYRRGLAARLYTAALYYTN